MLRRYYAATFLISASSPAHAYLDPGSGSMLLYALVSIAAMVAYSVRGLFHKTASFLIGKGSKDIKELAGMELVFYSEGGHYWNVFSPVIEALVAKGERCAYLTSDENDAGLRMLSSKVTAKYIGGEAVSAATLNNLTAKLVVMTTPQLGIFKLKRSKNVLRYAHLMHSHGDVLGYRRYAFDHFDLVFCSGPHHIKNIRKLEENRGTPTKELLETGLTYYDVMLGTMPEVGPKGSQKTVLIAPTWGANGLLARFGSACIRPLLDAGIEVILRPHPQDYVSQSKMMFDIEDDLKPYDNLTLDRSPSGEHSMAVSDVLISDYSGIIFDYAFVHSKPVIIIDCEFDLAGFEAEYVDSEIWEFSVRGKLGKLITEKDIPSLPSIVDEMMQSEAVAGLEQFREQSLYNFGTAGEVAANQIIEILGRQSDEVLARNSIN